MDKNAGPQRITIRPAAPSDASDLAVLADAATRRLVAWLWDNTAATGQSSFEVGRETIRSDPDHLTHFSRWKVAEVDGHVAGGLNSYALPAIPPAPAFSHHVLAPLNAMKERAIGTWYVSVASVFPEFRGLGVGTAILEHASELARAAGIDKLTLTVGSFNEGAHRLYQRFGFREWTRGIFVPFPSADPEGEWILMVKDLA